MTEQLTQILIDEIRENRVAIKCLNTKLDIVSVDINTKFNAIDKRVYSNKIKLSLFIGGVSLLFSISWAIIFEKVKTFL